MPTSPPDAPAHGWSGRVVVAVGTTIALDRLLQFIGAVAAEPGGSLNTQIKMFVRSRPEALLSPLQITDRDVVLAYDDALSSARWGLVLNGQQYVTLFAQWFDDRWAAIPDGYLIYSRSGLNQKALDRIRMELAAAEAARDRPDFPKSEAAR